MQVADQELTAKTALLRVVSVTMGKRVTSVPVLVLLVKPTSLAHCVKVKKIHKFVNKCFIAEVATSLLFKQSSLYPVCSQRVECMRVLFPVQASVPMMTNCQFMFVIVSSSG